jgi:hypothetical protein
VSIGLRLIFSIKASVEAGYSAIRSIFGSN